MAVAIEATSTIKVGARVFCVDYRQPVMFAKEMATLDFFSEGDSNSDSALDGSKSEYEAMGVAMGPPRRTTRSTRGNHRTAPSTFRRGSRRVSGRARHTPRDSRVAETSQRRPTDHDRRRGPTRCSASQVARPTSSASISTTLPGKLGPDGFGSGTAELTEEKIGWIRDGAGDRFGDLELEIAAYFTVVTDQRDETLAKMAPACALAPDALGVHPHSLDRVDRLDLRPAGRTTRTLWHLLRDVQRPCRRRIGRPHRRTPRGHLT